MVEVGGKAGGRVKVRRVGIRLETSADRLLGAGELPELVDRVVRPRGAFAFEGFAQGQVGFEKVVVEERRQLGGHFCRIHGYRLTPPRPTPASIGGPHFAQRDPVTVERSPSVLFDRKARPAPFSGETPLA